MPVYCLSRIPRLRDHLPHRLGRVHHFDSCLHPLQQQRQPRRYQTHLGWLFTQRISRFCLVLGYYAHVIQDLVRRVLNIIGQCAIIRRLLGSRDHL